MARRTPGSCGPNINYPREGVPSRAMCKRDEALLRSVVDHLPFAALALSASGKVQLWNKEAERLFGWKSSEVLGTSPPIIPKNREAEFRAFEDLALSGRTLHVRTLRQNKDQALIEVDLTIIPLRDEQNCTTGILGLFRPLGEPLVAAEQSLPPGSLDRRDINLALGKLTQREREVVGLVLRDYDTRRIAQDLGITGQVVRNHLHAIYRRLQVANRSKLIALLQE